MTTKNLLNPKTDRNHDSRSELKPLGIIRSKSGGYQPSLPMDRKRVMDFNVVVVEGIPKSLATCAELKSQNNFGRFGQITNIYMPTDENTGTRDAYITYNSKISSSLALISINRATINGQKLAGNYGTNRYCKSFLNNQNCQNKKCFYLHQWDQQNDAKKPENSKQKHIEIAINTILSDLNKLVQLETNQPQNNQGMKLISIKQIIKSLIQNRQIKEQDYNKARGRGRIVSQRIVLLKKNQNAVVNEESHDKLTKSLIKSKNQQINNSMLNSERIIPCTKQDQQMLNVDLTNLFIKKLNKRVQPYSKLLFGKSNFEKLTIQQKRQEQERVKKYSQFLLMHIT